MKGLLKGLRYISDMLEDKEPEMQIGMPTDVKHVAHIGTDGPATNKPSWMNEFNAAQELSSNANAKSPSAAGNHESLPPTIKDKKKSRRKGSLENGTGIESSQSPKGSEKHSRRHRSNHSAESSLGRESGSHGRSHSSEPPSQDSPEVPKKSRQKKSKASSGGSDGSSTSSRTKHGNSLPDITDLES